MLAQNYYELLNFGFKEIENEKQILEKCLKNFSKNLIVNPEYGYNALMECAYTIDIYTEFVHNLEQTHSVDEIELYLRRKMLNYNFSSSSSSLKSLNEKIEFKMLSSFYNIITNKMKTLKE